MEREGASVDELSGDLDIQRDALTLLGCDLQFFFLIVLTTFIFLMQIGFAFVEVGSVSPKHTKAVLLKNIGDAAIGALCWWLCGFGIAYGNDIGGVIGSSMFGKFSNDAQFVVSWAFAASSATIVSGAVAERVSIFGYICYATAITALIYPVIVHWVWSASGWASEQRENDALFGCGVIDFAGAGVVHYTGGLLAFLGAVHVGPRTGRFGADGQPLRTRRQSPALNTLGTLVLWTAWFTFNSGGLGRLVGRSGTIAMAVVNTVISPASAMVSEVIISASMYRRIDIFRLNNSVLIGLVGVTGCCGVIEPEASFVIGIVSAIIHHISSKLLLRLKVDDVVDASIVHGIGGLWGVLAGGLFTTPERYAIANAPLGTSAASFTRRGECCGVFYGCSGRQLAANAVFVLTQTVFILAAGNLLFFSVRNTVGLRIVLADEDQMMSRATRDKRKSEGTRYIMSVNALPPHGGVG